MRRDREDVAKELNEKLRAGERAVEHALRTWSELVSMIPRATAQSGVSLEMGQQVATHAGATVSGLIAVRGSVIDTHTALGKVRDHLGLSMYGPGADKPPTEGTPLMLVPAARG
jgi:hypothetical protein